MKQQIQKVTKLSSILFVTWSGNDNNDLSGIGPLPVSQDNKERCVIITVPHMSIEIGDNEIDSDTEVSSF